MTNTIHPWTMYEVARFRDEERILRAQAAMRALKPREEPRVFTHWEANRRAWKQRLDEQGKRRLRDHLHLLRWAQSHHLAPQHVHHARHG